MQHGLDEFFGRIRALGIVRTDSGRWGAGVASALGRRWGIDPVLIRGVFVALTVFGGLGVAIYGIGWLLLPQQDGRIHLQQAIRGDFTAGFIGAAVVSLVGLCGVGSPWHHAPFSLSVPGSLLVVIAAVAGIWWLARDHGPAKPYDYRDPATEQPQPSAGFATAQPYETREFTDTQSFDAAPPIYGTPSAKPTDDWRSDLRTSWQQGQAGWQAGVQQAQKSIQRATAGRSARELARQRSAPSRRISRPTLGLALLVAAGTLLIADGRHGSTPAGLVAAALALAVIGAGVIVSGLNGRRAPGLISIGLILALATLAGAGAHRVGIRSGQNGALFGNQEWRPSTVQSAGGQFDLGFGQGTLRLTDPAILTGATPTSPLHVRVRLGAGHLVVVLPSGVATQVTIQMGAGDVIYPDGTSADVGTGHDHRDRKQTFSTGPATGARLVLDVQQGAGQLELRTAGGTTPAAPTAPTPASAPPATVAPATPKAPGSPAPAPTPTAAK